MGSDLPAKIGRNLVRGTVGTAAGRMVEAVIGLVMVPFILGHLGSELYGLWALLYAMISYLNLADMGLSAGLNRHFTAALTSGNQREQEEVLTTALLLMGGFALLVGIAGWPIIPLVLRFFPDVAQYGSEAVWTFRALVITFALSYLANYGRSLLVSTHHAARMAALQIVISLGNAAVIVFVLLMGWGLIGLALGTTAFTVVRLLVYFIAGIHAVDRWRFRPHRFSRSVLNKLWSFGMWVQLTRLSELLNTHFGRIFVGRVMGMSSVTHFDLGMKAAQSSGLLSHMVVYVIEPAAAALHELKDRERFRRLLFDAGRFMGLSAFGMAAFVIAVAPELLVLWLEDIPDPNVVSALRLLSIALVLEAVTLPMRLVARGAGRPQWSAQYGLLHAGLNVLLSIGGYMQWGFIGILIGHVIASWVGYGLQTGVTLKGLRQPVGRFFLSTWAAPLAVTIPAAVLLRWALHAWGPSLEQTGRLEILPWVLGCLMVYSVATVLLAHGSRVMRFGELRQLLRRLRG
ncbi:oligosaccharide flippase family protein [bacterium]|nr:oligosaccharide flippase family protein [bacterium]